MSELFESTEDPFVSALRIVRNHLRAIDYFEGIQIVADEEEEIESKLNIDTESTGVVVVVMITSAHLWTPETEHPLYRVHGTAAVFENPTINRSLHGTRKPSLSICSHIAHNLNNKTLQGLGQITLRDPAIELVLNPLYLQRSVNWEVTFGTVPA